MSDVQRYCHTHEGMEEYRDGDLVAYEDYEYLAEQYEALKKMYSELADKIGAIWRNA